MRLYVTLHRFTWANGDVFEGHWMSDVREGDGKIAYAGGDAYEGEWHSDMRWGKGVQKYADGETYTGDWLKDVRHGDGKASVLGAKYEGEFVENKYDGYGTFIFATRALSPVESAYAGPPSEQTSTPVSTASIAWTMSLYCCLKTHSRCSCVGEPCRRSASTSVEQPPR